VQANLSLWAGWSISAGSQVVLFGRVGHFGGKPGRSLWAGSVHFGGFSPTYYCTSEFNVNRQTDDIESL
jgi:hypothetical protein